MEKFTHEHIFGIVLVILGIGYLLLHKRVPSTISTGMRDYPSFPLTVNLPDVKTPSNMVANIPRRRPVQQLTMSDNSLTDNFSKENIATIDVTDYRGASFEA